MYGNVMLFTLWCVVVRYCGARVWYGMVWNAHVDLHVLHLHIKQRQFIARQKAQLLQRLRHPHIVTCFDVQLLIRKALLTDHSWTLDVRHLGNRHTFWTMSLYSLNLALSQSSSGLTPPENACG